VIREAIRRVIQEVGLGQGQVALLLLEGMQAQDSVEPVKDATNLRNVSRVRVDGVDIVEDASEPPDQVSDLGVGSAHGCQGSVPPRIRARAGYRVSSSACS